MRYIFNIYFKPIFPCIIVSNMTNCCRLMLREKWDMLTLNSKLRPIRNLKIGLKNDACFPKRYFYHCIQFSHFFVFSFHIFRHIIMLHFYIDGKCDMFKILGLFCYSYVYWKTKNKNTISAVNLDDSSWSEKVSAV